jgi:uncharacterized protein (DUF1330 family)
MTEDTTPAYAMVQITINDPAEFNERYAQYVFPILDKFGAQMIAGSPTPQTKEGDFDGNWAAVLRFPNMQVAESWYHSAEYLPYKDLRINELTSRNSLVFVRGVDPTVTR